MTRTRARATLFRASLFLAALPLAGGCGSAEPSSAEQTTEAAPATVGSCPADSPAVGAAKTVASLDLDGSGGPEPVRLTAAGSDCPNVLFAEVGDRYFAAPFPGDQPPLSRAFGVALPGHQGELLVTRQDHPRGGFQLRVFAAAADRLAELRVKDRSLVPFVALDVEEHPWSIDCRDGGLVLTEAVTHEPAGVVFAWDIKRTTYSLEGAEVTAGPTEEIADNVLPEQLSTKYAELVRHAAFPTCRAAG